MNVRDTFFKIMYGFRGVPRNVGANQYLFDESLRRWNFDGEKEVRDALTREINIGDVAIDIGANFGMHTLIMADRVGESGQVIAFEPIPANLRLLRRNIKLNHFDLRVTVTPCAVSDIASKTLRMTMDSDSLEPSAAISTTSTIRNQETEVGNLSLDDALVNVSSDRNCLIKIDVEGAELSVLRSGVQSLKRLRPTLLIEVHDYALPSFNESTASVYAFLAEHGFAIEQLSDMRNHNGQYHHVLAKMHSDALAS